MPSPRPKKLTHTFVKNIARPGRYGDGRGGHGLSLLVKRMVNGRWSKTWSQRIRINGKYAYPGLGAFPVVTLADARAQAEDNAKRVHRGEDIMTERCAIPTVEQAFDRVIATRSPTWTGRQTVGNWRRAQTYCKPISSRLISDVTSSDVLDIIRPLWLPKPTTARDIRTKLSNVCQWAITEGYRDTDPASPSITRHLGKQPRPVHHRSLDHNRVGGALALVRDADAWWAEKHCLLFLALTCVRSGEARQATWDEIDWETSTWTIPAAHMKGDDTHVVPLSSQAIEILTYAKERTHGRGRIFPPQRGGKLMQAARLSKVMRTLEIPAVPHGCRASFRNWAAERETRIPRPAAEMVLAHRPSNAVVQAYQTSDFFEARKPIMQEWADYLSETMGQVISPEDQVAEMDAGATDLNGPTMDGMADIAGLEQALGKLFSNKTVDDLTA